MPAEEKHVLTGLWGAAVARGLAARGSGRDRFHDDLHMVLDALPIPIAWAALSDGVIHFANRAFVRTYGYGPDRLSTVDRWIDEATVLREDADALRFAWRDFWRQRIEPTEIDVRELRIRCANGEFKTVRHRGIILPEAGIGLAIFEDITQAKGAEDSLRRLAFEDPLTGIANRRALADRWQAATAHAGAELALLLIDIDDFKSVNDRLGHDAGDELLRIVAQRIRSCARAVDLPFRSGGDEFGLLIAAPCGPAAAEVVSTRVVESCRQPVALRSGTVSVSASVGVGLFPRHARSLRGLMLRADEALYDAKRNGKDRWALAMRPD